MNKANKFYSTNGGFCRVFVSFEDVFLYLLYRKISQKIFDILSQFQLVYNATYSQQKTYKEINLNPMML